jgi:hypothetical protein
VSLIFSKEAIVTDPKLFGLKARAPAAALLRALTAKFGEKQLAGYDIARAGIVTSGFSTCQPRRTSAGPREQNQ